VLIRVWGILFLALWITTACAPAPAPTPATSAPSAPSTSPAQAPTTAAAKPAQAPTAAATAATGATSVDVRLSEFKVDMPTTLHAGTVMFRVTNAGTIAHSFEIDGQGISKRVEGTLSPGQSATLQVDLKPGSYEAFCPVDGHRDQGMRATVTVGQ
jgi:uncharacterized cupredoxin-like copper-binding protein